MIKVNFRTKVLVPVILVMIGLVAVTVFVVNRRISRQFQTEAQNTLTTADTVFQNLQGLDSEGLLLRYHGLVNQPLYVALFPTGDPATLREPLQKLLEAEPDVAILFYATNSSSILACEQRGSGVSPDAFAASAKAALEQALQGREQVDTISAGNRLYEVISIPVYDAYKTVIGALTLGSEIGAADAAKFSEITRSQILFFADHHLAASTFTDPAVNRDLENLLNGVSSGQGVKQVSAGGQHYFYIAGSFNSLGKNRTLDYVLLSSYEDSLRALRQTQQLLVIVSVGAIFFGAAIVWFFVNKITRPLRELRDSAEAVGRGDYSRRVPVCSNDECGQLAASFNQMTEKVQQSRGQLEKTVETLKATQEQLIQSEKLSAVGEFVAGVAHELNNPLAAVMGFSELLGQADVDAKYRRQLDLIYKAAQRCQKIVQSLLSFARKHQPERKPVSANELVEAVLEIVAYQLRTGNIEVATALDPGLPLIMADGHQIQQVLLNIINNARQAMEGRPSGGKIRIVSSASSQNIRIAIQDSGPGITPENLRRIFDPFFTTKAVGQGTGLGLSLCYGIIKEHGGNIYAESQPGEGATFVIELPAARGLENHSAAAPPEVEKFRPGEGANRKVLVIDDEDAILRMVSEVLLGGNFEVDLAPDGESALRLMERNRYDVALCDWKMPGLNGRQIYERMSAIDLKLCERVIFITGDVINGQLREFLESEKRPCLSKPFAVSELRKAIRTVLKADKPAGSWRTGQEQACLSPRG